MVQRLRQRLALEHLHAQSLKSFQPRTLTTHENSDRGGAYYYYSAHEDTDYLSAGRAVDYANSSSYVNGNSAAVGAFRTSAAFLSSLRTNLRLHASPPPSPMSTPPSMQASTSSLPPPSPLAATAAPPSPPLSPESAKNPLDDIPPLRSYVTHDPDEMTAALKLVADSVAQMRQTASRALIFHPLNLALYIAFMSAVSRYIYKDSSDAGVLFTTLAGITMAALVSVRWLTSGYIYLAEDFSRNAPAFLQNADVLVTKFGDEVIGAVVIGWVPADSRGKRRKGWNGEVRGWAVRLRYRGKGVGTALLEDAVQEARKKGVESVGFADDHANSARPLWSIYNKPFERREQRARNALQTIWDNASARGSKKR